MRTWQLLRISFVASLTVVLGAGCGQGQSTVVPDGGDVLGAGGRAAGGAVSGSGGAGGGGGISGGGGTGGTGGATAPDPSGLPASYAPTAYVFPQPADGVACSGAANATAAIGTVFLAQTHSLSPGHPLFFLIAKRPALLEVPVTGTGASPQVSVEGVVNGASVGKLCLSGPATLPASVDTTVHKRSDRFTVTLPSAWLTTGLSLKITAGTATRVYAATDLGVGPAPELNLIMLKVDVLNYNEGKADIPVPASWVGDMAGAFPASVFRFGTFPVRVPLPKLASSTDVAGSPAVLLSKRPCEGTETPANTGNTCEDSKVPTGNVLAAVNQLTGALLHATGDTLYAYYYSNTENFFVGGWGGGKVVASAQFDGVMFHELGHALDLPHWGNAYPNTNPGVDDYRYPYGGVQNDGGGRGDSWNYYQNVDELISPICQISGNPNFGKERSDAMQRSNACDEMRSTGVGPWDGFGDFSALAMFRFMTGADAYSGTVPYRGGNAPFYLKPQLGWPSLVRNSDGTRSLVRKNQPTAPVDPWEQHLNIMFPEKWDVPVAMVYGSFNPAGGPANIVYEPLNYVGGLTRVVDPTDPAVFTDLAAAKTGASSFGDYFYWPRDITVRVTYQDGTTKQGVYLHGSYPREWSSQVGTYGGAWRPDTVYFAMAFPGDKRIDKVEVFDRPFCVRYAGDAYPGNINYAPNGITAATFMSGATLRSSWTRP